jgi:hypothetical protein
VELLWAGLDVVYRTISNSLRGKFTMCMVEKLCGNGGRERVEHSAFPEDVTMLLVDLEFSAAAEPAAANPAFGNCRGFLDDSALLRVSPSPLSQNCVGCCVFLTSFVCLKE